MTLPFCVILAICAIYLYIFLNKNHWKSRGIIFDSPIPIFGNYFLNTFGWINDGELLKSLYVKYSGERFIGLYNLLNTPELLLCDLDDIKKVLIGDFNKFQDRFHSITGHETLRENLLNARGETWKFMRQKVSPVFTTGKIKYMFDQLNQIGNVFMEHLEKICDNEFECKEIVSKFTTDVIGSCAFGINMNSISDHESSFRKYGKDILHASTKKSIMAKILSGNVKSSFLNMFVKIFKPKLLRGEHFFRSEIMNIFREREISKIKRRDLIDLLIELKNKDLSIDDQFLAAQCHVFFIAGFETLSSMMSFALYELAVNPEIQEKIFVEIREVINCDEDIGYETLLHMVYLDMFTCEVLRKHPPITKLYRKCTAPYTFPDSNLSLDVGDDVVISISGIHRDPRYYPEPERFIPERFSPEIKAKRNPMHYIPFGAGPRICIGQRFAEVEYKLCIAKILKDFIVEKTDKTPNKLEMNPSLNIFSVPTNGIWLNIKKRY